jgi:hypothetical protein
MQSHLKLGYSPSHISIAVAPNGRTNNIHIKIIAPPKKVRHHFKEALAFYSTNQARAFCSESTLLLIHSSRRSLVLSIAGSASETISRAFPSRTKESHSPSAHESPRASFLLA